MKRHQKTIVSWFVIFTMIFVNCFSNIFAVTADGEGICKNAMNSLTTESSLQVNGDSLQANPYEPNSFEFSGNVYLIGDSTVCEYPESTVTTLDRQGWGMRLGDYFNDKVTIHNLALSGRSSRSFVTEAYYTKLLNELSEGDYLFIQFGHNDQKNDGRETKPGLDLTTLDEEGKNEAGEYSYEWFMIHKYIEPALEKGAVPVLISPITRRSSSGKANYKDHVPYKEALESLAEAYQVPYIHLMSQTVDLYLEVFAEGGAEATAALHALKESNGEMIIDNTHLSTKGATLVSGLVAASVKALDLQLAEYIQSEEVADTK